MLFVPELLFGAVRYSTQAPNVDVGRRNEAMAGFHIFHVGHDAKLQTEAGFVEGHDGDTMQRSALLQIQYQLLL